MAVLMLLVALGALIYLVAADRVASSKRGRPAGRDK